MALSILLDKERVSKSLFFITGLLVMYNSMQLYITWFIPLSFTMILTLLSSWLYMAYGKFLVTKKRFVASVLITFVFIYEGLMVYPIGVVSSLYLFSRLWFIILLIFSITDNLNCFLKLIINATALLIMLSLVFWVFFLIGIPLPHYSTVTNDYYNHTVYYFFLLNGDENQLVPRFAGLFLEPGHLGSTASMLLFLNGMTMRKWQNVVFLVATILSLSLAAYGLLIGSIALHIMVKTRGGYLKIIPYIIALVAIAVFFMEYKGGDNPVNQKILMRLVFEDGQMSGSNRTSGIFDRQYEKYLGTYDTILGMGRSARENTSTTGTLFGTASWKRYFFIHGYIGSALLLIFLFYYLYIFRSKSGFAFLLIYLICNMIRDYPIDELWLYLVLTALPSYRYGLLKN